MQILLKYKIMAYHLTSVLIKKLSLLRKLLLSVTLFILEDCVFFVFLNIFLWLLHVIKNLNVLSIVLGGKMSLSWEELIISWIQSRYMNKWITVWVLSAIIMETILPGLRSIVTVYICCPVMILNNLSFSSAPQLSNEILWSHKLCMYIRYFAYTLKIVWQARGIKDYFLRKGEFWAAVRLLRALTVREGSWRGERSTFYMILGCRGASQVVNNPPSNAEDIEDTGPT